MIDWEDFPIRTPEQHMAEAKRVLQLPSMAAIDEEGMKLAERFDFLFKKYILTKRKIDLKLMSLDALLERFVEICLVEDELQNDPFKEGIRKYNDCQDALRAVHEELKARGPDARWKLTQYYNHFSYQVRLKAAKLSYRVAPAQAHRCLEALQKTQIPGIALEAGMTLFAIDDGGYTPD